MRGGVPSSTTRRTHESRDRKSAGRWRRSGCSAPLSWLVPDQGGQGPAWAASSCEISTLASATASFTAADSFTDRLSIPAALGGALGGTYPVDTFLRDASRPDRSDSPAPIRYERCHCEQHDCGNGRTHFATHQVKNSCANHHDHDASGRTGDKPRLNAGETRECQSHRCQYFGDTEKELKPARERRVHLVDYRRRWKEKQAPVGEERKREQHLEHPEHDIHAASRGVPDQGRS